MRSRWNLRIQPLKSSRLVCKFWAQLSCNSSVLSQSSPIRIKVTDANELPYPGVTVQAQVTNGGSLNRAMASSDVDGVVEFLWTQQPDRDNQLIAAVASGPSITITAGAPPVFAAGSVLNAASYVPGLVPGSIATIFGTRLGGQNAHVLVMALQRAAVRQ